MANSVPTAKPYPKKHNVREAKVIETARQGLATTSAVAASAPFVIVAAGRLTVSAGQDSANTADVTITGVVAGDQVLVTYRSGTAAVLTAVASAGKITIAGALVETDVIQYIVVRATALS